jgi:hypothetical protein
MNEKLVTVARFGDYVQAELARQLLEGEGITALVTGENVGTVWGIPPVDYVKLQTLESQAEEAKKILEASKQDKQELGEDEDVELDEDLGDEPEPDQAQDDEQE